MFVTDFAGSVYSADLDGSNKKTLLAAYHGTFGEARTRYQALQTDPGSVDAILRAGAERARVVAAPVIARVRQAVGIER